MNKQTPYSKENEYKNNSEHSANRALPPFGGAGGGSCYFLHLPLSFLFPPKRIGSSHLTKRGLYDSLHLPLS